MESAGKYPNVLSCRMQPVTSVYSSWMVVLCLEIKSNFLVIWKAYSFSSGILWFFSTTDSFSCRFRLKLLRNLLRLRKWSFQFLVICSSVLFHNFRRLSGNLFSWCSDNFIFNLKRVGGHVNRYGRIFPAFSSTDVPLISFSTSEVWMEIGSSGEESVFAF